jgi:hypothetical protein
MLRFQRKNIQAIVDEEYIIIYNVFYLRYVDSVSVEEIGGVRVC